MDQINLEAWTGRTETEHGGVSEQHAAQLHATLGMPSKGAPRQGDLLPPLWHWCGFPPTAPQSELGLDGHPSTGGFLPPIRLQRRMWAGGALEFRAPLRIGDEMKRRSSIRGVSQKAGASGPMVFVTVQHDIFGPAGLAISEQQDIVYLEIPDRFVAPKKRPAPNAVLDSRAYDMTETLLFRFSALTFNAHRIHYDRPYATQAEHYPELVVHGPLQAMLMMQLACARQGTPPRWFDFRGAHPMFCGSRLTVGATESDMGLSLFTSQDGHIGMQGSAMWEGTQ